MRASPVSGLLVLCAMAAVPATSADSGNDPESHDSSSEHPPRAISPEAYKKSLSRLSEIVSSISAYKKQDGVSALESKRRDLFALRVLDALFQEIARVTALAAKDKVTGAPQSRGFSFGDVNEFVTKFNAAFPEAVPKLISALTSPSVLAEIGLVPNGKGVSMQHPGPGLYPQPYIEH